MDLILFWITIFLGAHHCFGLRNFGGPKFFADPKYLSAQKFPSEHRHTAFPNWTLYTQGFHSQIRKSKPCYSIKVNKDIIKSRKVLACPELGTAQPQLVLSCLLPIIKTALSLLSNEWYILWIFAIQIREEGPKKIENDVSIEGGGGGIQFHLFK